MHKSIRFGLLPIALAMVSPLRADEPAAPAPASDQASIRADNKQLSEELAAAWKEAEHLKAQLADAQAAAAKNTDAQAAAAKGAADVADLQRQLDAAKAQPPAGDAGQLADVQDKLATSLRSFTVIQEENTQLKAQAEKLASDNASLSQQLDSAKASISSLQVEAAATSQIEPLRTQLRQAQDETSRLAEENAQLKTRVAIQGPGPGSAKPAPTRPDRAPAMAAPAPAAPTPAPPQPKTYVVAEGDTLNRIARKFYGSSTRWEEILKANKGVLKDEKSLVVGSTLTIP